MVDPITTSYAPDGAVSVATPGGRLQALMRELGRRRAMAEMAAAGGGGGWERGPAPPSGPTIGSHSQPDPYEQLLKQAQLEEAQGSPIYTDQSGGVYTGMEVRPGAGPLAAATGRYRRDNRVPGGNVY